MAVMTEGDVWRRARLVATAIGVLWCALTLRLLQLQGVQRAQFAAAAERQRTIVEEIPARPGDILDRQGRLLATTLRTPSLYVIPSHIPHPWEMANRLSDALEIPVDELFTRIGTRADRHFLWVKRRLSDEEVEKVRALNLPADQWGFREEFRRVYPQGPLAAQVLGLRDVDGQGRGGLEESLHDHLSGVPGRRVLTRDARGRVLQVEDDPLHPPRPGQSVQLTLDCVLQLFVERELDKLGETWQPRSCCAVVMDPQSGEVLAMASRPTFDPNHPERATADAWKNRVIADIYEPGSTFKPFIMAYGIDRDLLRKDESFHCGNGEYRMGGRLLHDHHKYGVLSLTDVLVKSSNIGMAKIGERLENRGLYEAAVLFGFGRKTGIELPGELGGMLRPLSQWNGYSTGSIPMGHEIAATPLQMLTAHAALANGGRLLKPTLLMEAGQRHEESPAAGISQMTVSQETAEWMIAGPMREVVTRGTGKKAKLPGYQVFGKTGTAQTLSPTGGYQSGRYISSFLCGAPVKTPRALVLVVVDQASVGSETFGGKVAAPAAAAMLKETLKHLRIGPDDGSQPSSVPVGPTANRDEIERE